MQKSEQRQQDFRQAITAFIEERRDAKLKGVEGETAAQTAAKYEYPVWLADAARRVTQIQAVTHVLKATHPDARGSSLYVAPSSMHPHTEIGTHLLAGGYAEDIVGNAAALDVYKFLKLEVDGRRLMGWLQADDADLLEALHENPDIAREWAEAFKNLIRPADTFASHTMAKQVYWCVSDEPCDDSGYHLLQPMFSSSLDHVVHEEINDARFGNGNKAARQAWHDKIAHEVPYRDYRNLVIRKLGGSNKQNVSQLNSERGGVNYLLASLPPRWDRDRPQKFLSIDSALQRFRYYEGVGELIKSLLELLKSDPSRTMETRQKRERIERALGEALAAFGMATREQFHAGWTRDDNCRLPLCEQLWLDPDRAELPPRSEYQEDDLAFSAAFEWKDWPDEVASRFGRWLNAILAQEGLPVGDAEHAHWVKQVIIDAEWLTPAPRSASGASVVAEGANHG